MLKTRVLTGCLLGLALLAGLFLLPARWAVVAFGIVFTAAAWEWPGFAGFGAPASRLAYMLLVGAALVLARIGSGNSQSGQFVLAVGCLWWTFAFLWLCFAPERQQPALTLVSGFFVLVPAFVALAKLLSVAQGSFRGPQLVLWLLLLVTGADIGAFFAGRRYGRRKLAPRVSPAKTWEGAAGGFAVVALVAWGGAQYFRLPVFTCLAFGCAVGLFSIIGDLTESMFKRSAGLKDSGNWLPGHGGILDRIDSVTAAAPLYALGLFGSGWLA